MIPDSNYKVIIDSGILIQYVQDYFRAISIDSSPLHYKGLEWEVFLIPQIEISNSAHASLKIPRTEIQFIGEKSVVDKIVSAYRLTFLSAGG